MMRFPAPSDRDRGIALPTVLVLGFVMIVLISTALTVASSGSRQAASVQRSTSALDAAYAGVQDYLARLNQNPGYVAYGNPASPFTAKSPVTGKASAVTPPSASDWNKAFGVGRNDGTDATSWATVNGSDSGVGAVPAQYRYEVDTTQYKTSGLIGLRVTGLSGHRTRTLVATIKVRGFVDYAYFSDLEVGDPDQAGTPTSCLKYAWAGRSQTSCASYQRQFGALDVIDGPVHSNDTMRICESKIIGQLTTANPATDPSKLYVVPSGCTPSTVDISKAEVLPMPSTNTEIQQEAKCIYTGPTQITYTDDGYMQVVSPWTKSTSNTVYQANSAACGNAGDGPNGLGSPGGARVKQLNNDALYVQNVPLTGLNAWLLGTPSGLNCIDSTNTVNTTATDGIGWQFGTGPTALRYPLANEAPAVGYGTGTAWSTVKPAYGCRNGDLYVQGWIGDKSSTEGVQTTAGAQNNVYVIGSIRYTKQDADIFGLVPQNTAIVWNPMASANGTDTALAPFGNIEIDAAIVSVAHSFLLQNTGRIGYRGRLTVFGSIAQKYRGSVSTGTVSPPYKTVTGYDKYYVYDPLLKTVSPPKFLAPSATSFAVSRYASVPLAFTWTGAAA